MWDRIAEVWRTTWDLHPSLLLVLGVLSALYVLGAIAMGRRDGSRPSPLEALAFGGGIATLFLALDSPLHHLADDLLFSAHMGQHLLITLVAPPLLLLGVPEAMVRLLLDRPWLRRAARTRAYPILAFAVFNLVFAYAHVPAIYNAVFGNEVSHRLFHVGLVATAVLTWLPMLSPAPGILPRLSQPAQMLYCFLQTLPGSLVGALLTLSDRVLYSRYLKLELQLGISPVADQQVGGLLMWVGVGTFWLGVLTVIFFFWADRAERAEYRDG